MLKANNIAEVKVPQVPDSAKLYPNMSINSIEKDNQEDPNTDEESSNGNTIIDIENNNDSKDEEETEDEDEKIKKTEKEKTENISEKNSVTPHHSLRNQTSTRNKANSNKHSYTTELFLKELSNTQITQSALPNTKQTDHTTKKHPKTRRKN
ncbi:hypothetical protein E2C01_078885 [Portunus trituberculatus]|uniref:Uncharacterized protein n=1 Tax=Portunus trituberculatus TaxID=210409 RepID=A0A5B7IRE4_PORTR|nr:hypothetical protein [Portunus trituberculatus]